MLISLHFFAFVIQPLGLFFGLPGSRDIELFETGLHLLNTLAKGGGMSFMTTAGSCLLPVKESDEKTG